MHAHGHAHAKHTRARACAHAHARSQEEDFFKRYLEYCRAKCSPRLTEAAAHVLASEYVDLREEARVC